MDRSNGQQLKRFGFLTFTAKGVSGLFRKWLHLSAKPVFITDVNFYRRLLFLT